MPMKVISVGGAIKVVNSGAGGFKGIGAAPPLPPYDHTVTLDTSTPIGTVATKRAAFHVQHSLEFYTADTTGTGNAYQHLRDLGVELQANHAMGVTFRMREIMPANNATRFWVAGNETTDTSAVVSCRGLEDDTGQTNKGVTNMLATINQGEGVLVAFGCPAWMRPGRTLDKDPPTPAFHTNYANLIVEILTRYPGRFKYVAVWNELKGWYTDSQSRSQAAIEEYADLFSAVRSAVRTFDSTIKVVGPHLDMGGYTEAAGRGDPMNPSSSGGYDYNAMTWFLARALANGQAPDIVSVDYSLLQFGATTFANGVGNLPLIASWAPRYKKITEDVAARVVAVLGSSRPVWWIEQYFDVNFSRSSYTDGTYTDDFQACMSGSDFLEAMRGGASAVFRWQPETRDTLSGVPVNKESWIKTTGTPGATSGTVYPAFDAMVDIQSVVPVGATMVQCTPDSSLLTAVATATKAIVFNRQAASKSVRIADVSGGQQVVTIPAWGWVVVTL